MGETAAASQTDCARRANRACASCVNCPSCHCAAGVRHCSKPQISTILPAIPPSREGRIAIVTDVGCGMRWTRQRQAREWSQGELNLVSDCEPRKTNGADPPSLKLRRTGTKPVEAFGVDGLRTAKSCGPDTRCWCQVHGGEVSPTGLISLNPWTTVTRRIRRRGERGISR